MEDTKIETLEDTDAEHMGPKVECSEASFMNLNTEVKNWKCAKMITGIVQIFFYMNKNSIFFSGYIICVYKLHSTLQL